MSPALRRFGPPSELRLRLRNSSHPSHGLSAPPRLRLPRVPASSPSTGSAVPSCRRGLVRRPQLPRRREGERRGPCAMLLTPAFSTAKSSCLAKNPAASFLVLPLPHHGERRIGGPGMQCGGCLLHFSCLPLSSSRRQGQSLVLLMRHLGCNKQMKSLLFREVPALQLALSKLKSTNRLLKEERGWMKQRSNSSMM